LIIALKGGEVTVLYPIIATSYVWVAFGSSYFFGEIISLLRWTGIIFIIIGIIMINFGEKDKGAVGFTEPV
jgi:undecaprenyl phosphate-alpha-L-ara4N flippase subunit ArnE